MRDKLVYEFLTTEQTYVSNLRIMRDFWEPAILFLNKNSGIEEGKISITSFDTILLYTVSF
jgi:hypothetical protein